MEYISRINIKVSSKNAWDKLKDFDLSKYGLYISDKEIIDNLDDELVINGEWSVNERELEEVVDVLSGKLGEECIIIADTINLDVDPSTFCVYYITAKTKTKCFYDTSKKCNMAYETDISNIENWLKYGGFRIFDKEYQKLNEFGICLENKKIEKKNEPIKKDSGIKKQKYISKINILVDDVNLWKSFVKNYFKKNNFQNCTDIDDAKIFFENYNKKSLVIENWNFAPEKMTWFCIINIPCMALIETTENKKNGKTYCRLYVAKLNKHNDSILTSPPKADIRDVENWLREAKIRRSPKINEIINKCLED